MSTNGGEFAAVQTEVKVCLVGPNQQENLGLGYLASSLERAGYRTELLGFAERDHLPSVVAAVLRHAPRLVGLGMPFQYAVGDYLELACALRDRGYQGHLTVGGHVATFCYRELLDSCPAIDTVVLHEGEQTLVELVHRLEYGEEVQGLPGAAWRENGRVVLGPRRPVLVDLDQLPFPWRSPRPYLVGGIPVAFVLTARGCIGECSYCCVRGMASAAGGPRLRLRAAEAVGEELGLLVRRGVRIVFVQDDLFVLPDPRRAVARMEALREACQRHGAEGLLFWAKSRPESVTPAVLEAAVELGVGHLFLGVEHVVDERLQYLGRTHRAEHIRHALELCRTRGIGASFDLMLFDPDSPLDHVAAAVDFAAEHLDLPWNICRTEVYPGTDLFRRLATEQRLEGDFRSWGYRIRDPRAELAFRVLRVCLYERAFHSRSLLNELISLAFAVQAQERLIGGVETERIARRAHELGCAARQDTVEVLRRVLDFAARSEAQDPEVARRFAVEEGLKVGQRDLGRYVEVERLWDLLQARGQMLLGRGLAAPIS